MKSVLVCRIGEVRWMEGTLFTILIKIILLSSYSRSVKSRGNSQRIHQGKGIQRCWQYPVMLGNLPRL